MMAHALEAGTSCLLVKTHLFTSDQALPVFALKILQIAMMIMDCQKVQNISDKLCLSPKTVNSYRYRIFEKLNVNSDVELTLLAVRNGLLDVDRPK